MPGNGFPNDVALIKLKTPANLTNEFIGIVPMAPAKATDADYSNCVITGWGATKKGMSLSFFLFFKVFFLHITICSTSRQEYDVIILKDVEIDGDLIWLDIY